MLKLFAVNQFSGVVLTGKTGILIKIIWSVLTVMTISLGIGMFLLPENILRYCVILILLWIVSVPLLIAAKRGHEYLIACLYISFLLLMIFGFSWTGGGIKGHGIKLLPIVVLFAGLTLGRREILWFGMIAVAGALVLVLADYYGLISVREPIGDSQIIYWLFTSTGIVILCYKENLTEDELRKALNEAGQELILRKKSEELLIVKNEKLAEIAFLQSHIVRKPVAHILGLIPLLKQYDPTNLSDSELLPCLEAAAKELDEVIHQIVKNTFEIESIVKKGQAS